MSRRADTSKMIPLALPADTLSSDDPLMIRFSRFRRGDRSDLIASITEGLLSSCFYVIKIPLKVKDF